MSESQQTTTRKLLKKITVATCDAKPNIEALINFKNEHGENAIMPLLTVVGSTSAYRAGESNGQAFVRFLGQFKAIRASDQAEFRSGQCILPGAAPDLLYGALSALGEQGGSVEFVFNIGVHYDESAATNYIYDVQQVVGAQEDDPLTRLENMAKQAALPAPTSKNGTKKKAA